MEEDYNPSIIEIDGKYVKLNKNNIKDIYFSTMCNTICISSTIKDFLEKEFDNKTILKWNNIYVNSYLDKIEELMVKDDLETIRTICQYFETVMRIYTVEKETYSRIILMLKKMFEKYGYFMNYSFLDVDPDCKVIGIFKGIYIGNQNARQSKLYEYSHGSIRYYIKGVEYTGLIPCLYYLNYFDLLWQCLDEIIFPIYEHFNEKSKYLKDNNLEYNEFPNRIDDYTMKILMDSFFMEYNINK